MKLANRKTRTNRSLGGRGIKKTAARYAAAAAAMTAVSQSQADPTTFLSPYSVPTNNFANQASMTGTLGDWTGAFSGSGSLTSAGLDATSSPTSISFSLQHNLVTGTRTYDFTAPAQAGGNVSFTLGGLSSGPIVSANFTTNGVSAGSILANGPYTFAVGSGDIFGFRYTVGYSSVVPGFFGANLSNFDGPVAVPEPAPIALWMGAGVVGLMTMRQSRRRNQRA